MRIVGAASAFPKYHYDQKTLCEAFLAYWGDRLPEPRKFELLHSNVGVNGRHHVGVVMIHIVGSMGVRCFQAFIA